MQWNRHHLAVAHVVARTQNISAAAKMLGITQPAVSRQIAELETAVGLKLFDRGRAGATPTAAGLLLYEHTTRLEAIYDRLSESMDDLKIQRAGRLRIGASSTIAIYLVPNLLVRYEAHFPGIQTQIIIGNSQEIEQAVADGTLDFGMLEGVVHNDKLKASVFAEDELLAVAPAKHSWASRKIITPQAFLKERYIAREPGSGTREVIDSAFVTRGLSIEPFMTVRSTAAVKAFVAAGHGVSILSSLTLRDETDKERFVTRPIRGLRLKRDLLLVRPAHTSLSPAALSAVQLVYGHLPKAQARARKHRDEKRG